MGYLNVNDEVFNELITEINSCKKWSFYGLDSQYFFIERVIIKWCSIHSIDNNIQTKLINDIKEIFAPNYCIINESKKIVEINDKTKVNKYYKSKNYSIIQLTLLNRIEKIKFNLISKYK